MNLYALGTAGLALFAALAWAAVERDGRKDAEFALEGANIALAGLTASLMTQRAETRTANDFVADAAAACAAEVRPLLEGRAAGADIRNARDRDPAAVYADGLCRRRPDHPACRAPEGAAQP